MTSDVLIMGGGATGQLAAAYLRKHFPDLLISVVEGPHKNRPIVGESFVELTIEFLLELGFSSSRRLPRSDKNSTGRSPPSPAGPVAATTGAPLAYRIVAPIPRCHAA